MDIATLTAAPFAALAESGLPVRIYESADAESPAAEARVARVAENPRGTVPGSPRTAFSVHLHLPPHIQQYMADIWLGAESWPGRVGPLHISRVGMPSPDDSRRTVYQLICA